MQSAAILSYEQRPERLTSRPGNAAGEIRSAALPGARLALYTDFAAVKDLWRSFETRAHRTAFQSFDYLQAWYRHVGKRSGWQPAIVVVHGGGEDVLAILPLAVSGSGLLRRLTWLGQEVCDYLGPISSGVFAAMPAAQFRALWREIGDLLRSDGRFRHDYVELRRMPAEIGGRPNPAAHLPAIRHASDGHITRLGANWREFYNQRRTGKARKQDRAKARRLAEFGEIRLLTPEDPEGIARILHALFAQRAENFTRKGIRDVLDGSGYRDVFLELATSPETRDRVHVSALAAGPSLVATALALEQDRRYSLLLIGYDRSFAQFSPGALHLIFLIERAIERGIAEFDFLVGEQRLKREWADVTVPLHDHVAAATWRGLLAALPIRGRSRLKRFIKQNRSLWTVYTSLRAVRSGLRP